MEEFSVPYGSQNIKVRAKRINNQIWYHYDGITHVYDLKTAKKRSSSCETALDGGDIIAPMPGKIIKVHKAKGETILQGEVVLVMEAMKMEYSLKANTSGSISELNCVLGGQVKQGTILAKIQSEEVNAEKL